MKYNLAKILLAAVAACLPAAAQTNQPNAHMKSYGVFFFNGSNEIFTTPTTVSAGDWVEFRITCQTSRFIQDCGVPEYYDFQTGYRLKFNCSVPWTMGGTTEEVCGAVATGTGNFIVYFPVLQEYILYEGSYEVIAGPASL